MDYLDLNVFESNQSNKLKAILTGSVCLLSKSIIHSNPIYIIKLDRDEKKLLIKFLPAHSIAHRELFCNSYLKKLGLNTPNIILYEIEGNPYIVMEFVEGRTISSRDTMQRVKDLAKVQKKSSNDPRLKLELPILSKQERIRKFVENIQILKGNPFIHNKYFSNFREVLASLKRIDSNQFDSVFCFYDFFSNNSIKSNGNIYYFDFEKACISSAFLDLGCIIINFPHQYAEIKREYKKQIFSNNKNSSSSISINRERMFDLLINLGVCEKVLDDAAFLSNDQIIKTKSIDICKRIAKEKIDNVRFIFDNIKECHKNEK